MTTTLARRAGVFALIAATAATTLTGCAGVVGARMTFDDTEKTRITGIRLDGSSGDVSIRTAAVTETSIKRIVRHSTGDPGESYRLDGSTLVVDTSCGHDCTVSYEIVAPAGVKVGGELRSGDIALDAVGDTDVKLTSGTITVTDPAGTVKLRATSGDQRVVNAKKAVEIDSTSGTIDVVDAAGPLDLKVTSGDISAELAVANSVTARSTSGNVQVRVPAGDYRIVTGAGSGDANVDGLVSNPSAKNVLDVRTGSGDATVSAA
jgi:hypothetical protein